MAEGSLPVRLSSFVGRDEELAELEDLVSSARLVTLIGPGGSGKSRLALVLGQRVQPRFGNGVWWVGLAHVTEPAGVLPALAEALHVPDVIGSSLRQSITRRLQAGPALLVLDNCEHLLDESADLAAQLLADCPALRVVATSQVVLNADGEVAFAVPPLPESTAVQLFVERARGARHGFALTGANADDVAHICRKLDGLPLAIELAAAWAALLTPAQIDAKLGDSLAVLVGGDRASLPRHRAMQAALDWSWQLLSEPERRLLARLSVFPGSFGLEAVEAVSAESGNSAGDVLRLLSQLVNRSLVLVAQGAEARYRLLQVVRLYAAAALAGDEAAARLHADHFLSVAERIGAGVEGTDQQLLLELLDTERGNIRTALTWCREHGHAEGAVRIAAACGWASYLEGRFSEGRAWLEEALAVPGDAPAELRANALISAASLAHLQGDEDASGSWLQAGLETYRAAGDRTGVGIELNWLGGVAMRRGNYAEARRFGEQTLALWEELGDESRAARALDYLCMRELLGGSLDRAAVLGQQAYERHERSDNTEALAWATVLQGGIALYRGDLEQARELLARGVRLCRAGSYRNDLAWALNLRGVLALRAGGLESAWSELREGLRLHVDAGNRWRAASLLETLAGVAGSYDAGLAARLLGNAAKLRSELGTPVPAVERADVERITAATRGALETDAFAEQWAAGEDRAIEVIADELPTALSHPVAVRVAEPVQPLVLHGFGTSAAKLDGSLLGPADWGYAKPRELLFFLLGEVDAHKDAIGAALWPEASTVALRNSFHTCLHQLRRALGRADRIVFGKGRYAFNRGLGYSFDVELFESALVAGRLAEAVDLYHGDYCADLSGGWVEGRRTALRQAYEAALLELAGQRTAAGDHGTAARLYRRAIEHDPLLEVAHRELMATYARLGDRGRALRHYQTLVELLADELGVGPSAESVALHAALIREPDSS